MNNLQACQSASKEQTTFAKDEFVAPQALAKSPIRALSEIEIGIVAGAPETQNEGFP